MQNRSKNLKQNKAQLKNSERLFLLLKEPTNHKSLIGWGEKKREKIEMSSMPIQGSFKNSEIYQRTNIRAVTEDFDAVLEGEFDAESTSLWLPPSESLSYLFDNLDKKVERPWNGVQESPEGLIKNAMDFPNYFNAGEIDYGVHGPELINGQLYMSIYHYLEFNAYSPRSFNTNALGKYLSTNNSDISICKYKAHDFEIRKYNYHFLKSKESEFEVFKNKF